MPPYRKTLDPEEALKRDHLTLKQLGGIVAIPRGAKKHDREANAFEKICPERLRSEAFFQSPIDKSAWTILKGGQSKAKKNFAFNASGVLPSNTSLVKALLAWLRPTTPGAIKNAKKALGDWVTTARPPEGTLFDEIEEKLREAAVQPELLYNQPICRLVRRDQLRYDPNYQALYQITPAQEQLMRKEEEKGANYDRLQRNQRVYWGISETFQSLVALFDSDLGRGEDAVKDPERTKELIRIAVQEKANRSSKALSPAGLNRYSPLRFWSPPPSFASSVFHMLFWRSIITGKDLFRRPVPGKSVHERAESYYVIVNYFNPAKFRIADYPNLFRAILTIARELAKPRSGQGDVPLPDSGSTRIFYPRYFPDVKPQFQEFKKLTLSIPFSAYPNTTVWDLAEAYKSTQSPDPISCLLRFLRDRAIELILWSTYQMEIRSIGLIPIQYLYQINLTKGVQQFFTEMIDLHGESPDQMKRKNLPKIIRRVSEKLLESNFNSKVVLQKAYGGPRRDVFRTEILKQVPWLAQYNPKHTPDGLGTVSASSEDPATRDEEENQ
jgi:hypothetical protein